MYNEFRLNDTELCSVIIQLQKNIFKMKEDATKHVEKSWPDQKNRLKNQFNILRDKDLRYENGKKDEMLEKVRQKLGKTEEEFESLMAAL